MPNLSLYVPKIEDYWYEQELLSDPLTMSYNAGYDVSYAGYHFDTGCIDFPLNRWEEAYDKRVRFNKYFAYLRDDEANIYVGTVNFQYNPNDDIYECGIVIEAKYRNQGFAKIGLELMFEEARKEGIKELYDNFEVDRGHTLELFKSVGFEVYKLTTWKKNNKYVQGVIVRKVL
ncbi:MAG: GNAT family N-acetyltransferase [Acholeplasmatales bacterium]|nr:GNAT family N-acetyltransferase [Acholeplasmatales bacterium]